MTPEIGGLVRDLRNRIAKMVAGLLVVMVGVVAVAVFLCVALYVYLQTLLPVWLAALGAAAIVLLFLIFVVILGVRRIGRLRRKSHAKNYVSRTG